MGKLHKIRRAWERMDEKERKDCLDRDGELSPFVGAWVARGTGKVYFRAYHFGWKRGGYHAFIRSLVGKERG